MTAPARVVVVVRTLDPGNRTDDVPVGERLARELAARGHPVELLPWSRAHTAGPCDLFVTLSPGTEPSWAPPGAVRVGWAVDDASRWASYRHVSAFDRLVSATADGLAVLRARAPRAEGVLPVPSGARGWEAVVDTLLAPPAGPAAPRHALHFFPNYSPGNPYQDLLHGALATVDAYDVPVTDLRAHLRRSAEHSGDPGVLALHWTGPILRDADGPFRTRLELDRFATDLAAFTAAGGRLAWTVHNVLPHEVRHRWAEVELVQLVADHADLVHVLSQESLEQLVGTVRVDPAKVVVIEHSSYLGHYPDEVTRAEARSRLGLGADDEVLVAVGGIRPYKGLDLLLDVLDDVAVDHPEVRLLVAGQALEGEATDVLRQRCAADPRVVHRFERVDDADLQVWNRAADLAVLPYRDILNSGAFLLAQTFGLPVVAPRAGTLRGWEGHPQVTLFTPGDRGALAAAVSTALDAVREDAPGLRAAALAAARERSPAAMGAAYAEAVAPLLSRGPAAMIARTTATAPGTSPSSEV